MGGAEVCRSWSIGVDPGRSWRFSTGAEPGVQRCAGARVQESTPEGVSVFHQEQE